MYFELQRVVALVAEAAAPRRPGFDPSERLGNELRRVLAALPPEAIPPDLKAALLTGEAVGPTAAEWLPRVRRWLADECARSALP
ncbi:hypothetical protein [Tahibacter harae]|uniref:Uncharacterized protein n=1 Tax=Tahibacter harae TaxID=2963937 RepID=A0ABT1QZM1_9GAMM|nr:hypothetical protein [Tahibacter harae]MCQ4167705.1 hypothetical protein [Tahibacter harae]